MAQDSLLKILRAESGGLPDDFSADALDRILTEPQQDALAEAIAADAVDAVPIAGDVLALTRAQEAEDMGLEYPDRPAFVENVLSDIPAPLDTIGDILISQNVLNYLEANYDVQFPQRQENLVEQAANSVDDAVSGLLPGNQN